MNKAIYGFSGDPITYGHIDIIQRSLKIFGELVVGIGMNPAKKYFFTLEERREIAAQSLKFLPNVKVIAFRGLLVDYAYEHDIKTVVRGIRNSEDLTYELMLHQIGVSQKQHIDTIYLPARQELMHVSSGAVKALQLEQGLIHEYVPLFTKQKLEERLSKQYIIAITGEIGVGKSYISQQIKAIGESQDIAVHIIDIDNIGHQILGELLDPIYQKTRQEIGQLFGQELLTVDGFINRKKLGEIIFSSPEKLEVFNQLLYKPLLLRLRRELYGKQGLILLDSALIAESNMTYLSNNNTILVKAPREIQRQRLVQRGYTTQQIENRFNSQFNESLKKEMIIKCIKRDYHGNLWEIDNAKEGNSEAVLGVLRDVMEKVHK